MPRRKRATPRDLQAQAEQEIEQELDALVAAIAAEEGLASGARRISPAKEVELWGLADPQIDPETFRRQLLTGTVPPELYDPQSDRRLAVLRMLPDHAEAWAGVFAEPLDEQMADLVTDVVARPGRAVLLAPYEDDPEQQVRVAERVNRRWLREQGMAEDDGHGYGTVEDVPRLPGRRGAAAEMEAY